MIAAIRRARDTTDLAAPRTVRYRTIDHWRGIACLLVVVYHSTSVWALGGSVDGSSDAGAGSSLAALILSAARLGWVGVPLFFVISGYAISATADLSRRRVGGVRGYAWRRFRRIYPPYWAMLGVQIGLMLLIDVLLVPRLLTDSPAPIDRPWLLSGGQWLGNLTLTESWLFHLPLVTNERAYVLGQAWTLCYEEQFYLVMGALILLVPRRLFAAAALVTIGVLLTTLVTAWLHVRVNGLFIDGYWLIFAAGILIYRQVNYGGPRSSILTWGTLAMGVAFSLRHAPRLTTLDEFMLVGFLFAGLLLLFHRWDGVSASQAGFEPIRFLGTICYSLYLSHAIVVRTISTLLWNAGIADPLATLVLVVPISVAAAIAVGTVFHRLIERRFISPSSTGTSPSFATSSGS